MSEGFPENYWTGVQNKVQGGVNFFQKLKTKRKNEENTGGYRWLSKNLHLLTKLYDVRFYRDMVLPQYMVITWPFENTYTGVSEFHLPQEIFPISCFVRYFDQQVAHLQRLLWGRPIHVDLLL